jgi:hypothetical protein
MARRAHGLAQLPWSQTLNISQRHVSFIELGRARASRQLIIDWMQAAGAPRALLTAALQKAGYADPLNQPLPAQPLPQALRLLLEAPSPCPLLVMDADWRLRGLNAAGARVCAMLMPALASGAAADIPMVDVLAAQTGFFDCLGNAPEVACDLLTQLQQDSWMRDSLLPSYERLAAAFHARFSIRVRPLHECDKPFQRRLQFEHGTGRYAFQVVQCSYPSSCAGNALAYRMEHWVPQDLATEELLRALPREQRSSW